jgi:4-amino-4-deoxy-L-arabinose transferase-like glycosyltransferase
MSKINIIILLFSGFILFVLSMVLRAKSGRKYEIKTIDLILVLVPLFLWLIGTGKVKKLAIGGNGI